MEKKNTDYSASAVNLKNPQEVLVEMVKLKGLYDNLLVLQNQLETYIPKELKDRIEICQKYISEQNAQVRLSVDTFGSYQDLEQGWYAVKQRKVSKSYNAEAFEKTYPQFAPAVIIKAVDTTKLNGLIKGGLIDEPLLKGSGIIKESESFAYIIK